MEHLRTRAWVWGLAAALLLCAAVAVAQPTLPYENHYKLYRTSTITVVKPVTLVDQFLTPITVTDFVLERFANPAEKRHTDGAIYPIINPIIHQLWWRINVPQPARTIIGIDQFGINPWTLFDAMYLVNPALKNVPVPPPLPPVWNHYLCYRAQGPTLGRPVIVIDQFGGTDVVVLYGKMFCNPVEKSADGNIYPIIDPVAHLACYQIQDATPFTRNVTAVDQFGYWQLQTFESDCFCVPALKEHTVKTQESTWGRIKALYQ